MGAIREEGVWAPGGVVLPHCLISMFTIIFCLGWKGSKVGKGGCENLFLGIVSPGFGRRFWSGGTLEESERMDGHG